MSLPDLTDYFLEPWRHAIVEGHARGIMVSENGINGHAGSTTPLLSELVRDHWNFSGYVVSDCGEIDDTARQENVSKHRAVAMAIAAGTDMECADRRQGDYSKFAAEDVAKGLLNESQIDIAVSHVLRVQFELGELDPAELVPWRRVGPEQVGAEAHTQLAWDAAAQTVVLLQNNDSALPLKSDRGLRVAVVGPFGNLTTDLLGELDYVTANTKVAANSLIGVLNRTEGVADVRFAHGCTLKDNCNGTGHIAHAEKIVADADVVVFALGLTTCGSHAPADAVTECETEGHDRFSLDLPGAIPELVERVAASAPRDATIVGVVFHGGALALEPLVKNCHAILDPHHPGQIGAQAVVAAMFGRLNPSARLADTAYGKDFTTLHRPNMTDMRLRGGPATEEGLPASHGVTHWYADDDAAVFPFGHGLSFSTFEFAFVPDDKKASSGAELAENSTWRVHVRNVAGPAGAATVLGFVRAPDLKDFPKQRLFDFARTPLIPPGGDAVVELHLRRRALALTDARGHTRVAAGDYILGVGDPGHLVDQTVHIEGDVALELAGGEVA